jgi:multiple sugar transport system ATP-binding protein
MNAGRIEQVGAPMELYATPKTLFVAAFIGSPRMNLVSGESARSEGATTIGVRPEHIAIDNVDGIWAGRLRFAEHLGNETIAYVESDAGEIIIRLTGHHELKSGALRMTPDRLHLHRFDGNGNRIPAAN